MEKATFAAGCFWHVQHVFDKVEGVINSKVGYVGGEGIPSYETAERLGHAEAIQIEFDQKKVSYEKLLDIFWKEHDPTSLNRQGPDVGNRYRSAIFYHNEEQKKIASFSLKKQQEKLQKKIVTQIVLAKEFFPAEEYHQKYFEKNKNMSCRL